MNNTGKSFFSNLLLLAGITAAVLMLQGCGPSETGEPPLETLPMNEVPLETMDGFQPAGDNWRIAGDVQSDRRIEHDLTMMNGAGVLINTPGGDDSENLFTCWSHGDLELEFDFLMPKGSNSGVYLMGRYEVQMLDSWGVDDAQFSDLGGIYRRWDENRPEGQKGFEGNPPRMNAARAPGLWQHFRILFRAPEFDESGQKVSNALFEEVWLNGVLVQRNVELSGPTRAAAYEGEQAAGTLMFQGDHGPVALRNIRYKKYDKKQISLTGLTYEYYPGVSEPFPDFSSLRAGETGPVDSLAGNLINRDDRYALRYSGSLETPNEGTYLFKLRNDGTVRMLIDGESVFDQVRPHRMTELQAQTVDLESGQHHFVLEFVDHPNNWYQGLSLHAEGPRLRMQKLHASSSVPGGDRELPALAVETGDRVRVMRSFAMHKGIKRTHVVNVGAPNEINYSYDLGQAALLQAWEGSFLNTNKMWINRGEPQTADPLGPPVTFFGRPSLALLNEGHEAWPDSLSWERLDVNGYRITEEGWPVFLYTLDGVEIEDRFEGISGDRRLRRSVRFNAPDSRDDLWLQLASGKEITKGANGEYVVDDRSYYLSLKDSGGMPPELAGNEGERDLRLPVLRDETSTEIIYEIIW